LDFGAYFLLLHFFPRILVHTFYFCTFSHAFWCILSNFALFSLDFGAYFPTLHLFASILVQNFLNHHLLQLRIIIYTK
jgi:hypothetical protein